MPENLAAFHARVDGFSADSLPHEGGFATRDSLTLKVDGEGRVSPFFGSTVIWELAEAEKLALSQRQVLLQHHAGWCLAEPLTPESFHITLHDLVNGSEEEAVADRVMQTESKAQGVLEALKAEGIPAVRLVSTHVFSMVSTSLVMGFAPETEADCAALMRLYECFHAVAPLAYGLTPHATLAYYKPGAYGAKTVDALRKAIHQAEQLPPLHLTLMPEKLFYRRFSDMNHYF